MRVAIIGAGFTGLAAAYELTGHGARVTMYEKADKPGGLAIGFQKRWWKWPLEEHYHHWFTNDMSAIALARSIDHGVLTKHPKTSVYLEGELFQFDSPQSLFTFPKLSIGEKIRMAAGLGVLRYNPYWQPLEKYTAASILPSLIGGRAYDLLWKPLLFGKFGDAAKDVSLAWFWARIVKRTSLLLYPKGGFLSFAKHLEQCIRDRKATVHYSSVVMRIVEDSDRRIIITYRQSGKNTDHTALYDKVLVTLPSYAFLQMAQELPRSYTSKLLLLRGLGAVNFILRLQKQFLTDGTYWLNVCQPHSPVLAVVEHTNFIDKRNYNNEHIVYVGNYVPPDHPYFSMTKTQLLRTFDPFLRSLNAQYQKSLIGTEVFKAPFVQPIIPINYSHMMPACTTPLKNVYLANIQQVYPWDRGTSYAIELGQKVSHIMLGEDVTNIPAHGGYRL